MLAASGLRQKARYWISRDSEQKNSFGSGGSGGDFRSLRVRAFDPQSNFASTLMFEKKNNFSENYFFGRSKDGNMIFSVKSRIFMEFRVSHV